MNHLEEYRRRHRQAVLRCMRKAAASDQRKPIRVHIKKLLKPRRASYQEIRQKYGFSILGFDWDQYSRLLKRITRVKDYPFEYRKCWERWLW